MLYLLYSILFGWHVGGADHVPSCVDEALGLVLVRDEADDAVAHEVGCDRVAAEAGHVRSEDAQDLVEELLDKC